MEIFGASAMVMENVALAWTLEKVALVEDDSEVQGSLRRTKQCNDS
jgi:hypothetical protein